MIHLTCTKCKATLEMDEAFAGGVCRCQHCGTIQTVPSHLKATAAAPAAAGAKGAYSSAAGGTAGIHSGLDDLADVVASSGLSNSALTRPGPAATGYGTAGAPVVGYQTPRPQQPPKSNTTMLIILAGAVVALLLGGLALFLLMRPAAVPVPATTGGGGGGGNSTVTDGGGGGGTETVVITGPHFATAPIVGTKVVYVLDRGSGMSGRLFDGQRAALNKSIRSLAPGSQFAVVFWKRGDDLNLDEVSFPKKGLANATPEQADECYKKFEDLTASGAAEIQESLKDAVARNPDAIVIATPKAEFQISAMGTAIDQALVGKKVKVYTVSYAGTNPVLKGIADKTGGKYVEASSKELGDQ